MRGTKRTRVSVSQNRVSYGIPSLRCKCMTLYENSMYPIQMYFGKSSSFFYKLSLTYTSHITDFCSFNTTDVFL